jgi:predicted NBD/HSP70 family sugar kinase
MVIKLTSRKDISVGISFPGYLEEGLLKSCPNIPLLEGKPLRQLLHRHIKHPLIVENDANCFALAEQQLGAGKGKKYVVGLIVGTGIGTGIIANDQLFMGSMGGAGELGHVHYKDGMSYEEYAAGPGIMKRYLSNGGIREKAEKIFEKKTLVADKTIKDTITAISSLCIIIIRAYDPEIIVLGGGVSNAPILKEIQKNIKEEGFSCKIVRNELGDGSGSIGAALLALKL